MYKFGGYKMNAALDTDTHEIEVGTVTAGKAVYTVNLLRPADTDYPFLVSRIERDGKVVFDYKKHGSTDYGRLAWAKGELVVAFIGKGRDGKVITVVAINDIESSKTPTINRRVELKHDAGEYLDRDVDLDAKEQRVRDIIVTRRRDELLATEQKKHVDRAARREARRQEMLSREVIHGFTSNGVRRRGIPVVRDEWHSLDEGVWVMLVESYEDGVCGKLIESFVVMKGKNGRPQKQQCAQVIEGKRGDALKIDIRPVGDTIVEKDGEFLDVTLYASMDDIKLAQKQGLNGGSFVAVKSDTPKLEIYSVTSAGIKTEGMLSVV